mgnify:FL=1
MTAGIPIINHTLSPMRLTSYLIAAIATLTLLPATSCRRSVPTVAERLSNAREAVAASDYSHAQGMCDDLAEYISETDSTAMTDMQAGELAMLFMTLSDHQNEDENVAVATRCLMYAYRVSPDSLRSFASSLSFDEQRHFELLRRISMSIDNPVDLMGEEFLEDETTLEE